MDDPVNSPSHYKAGGMEVIDIIEAYELNYRLGNVVKYVLRADRKGKAVQDLKKAIWYLQREVNKREHFKDYAKLNASLTILKPDSRCGFCKINLVTLTWGEAQMCDVCFDKGAHENVNLEK